MTIALNPNPNYNRTGTEHAVEYLKTSNGAFRSMQIAERVINLALNVLKDLSQATISSLKYAAGKLNVAWSMLTVPRIPETIKSAKEALARLLGFSKSAEPSNLRAYASDLNKLGDCGATVGFSIMGLTNNPAVGLAVKPIAEVADFVTNATDLVPATDDLVSAYKHRTEAEKMAVRNPDVERVLSDTMKYSLLKLVKPIVSVACVIFGLLAVTYGGPLLPALAFITMGLVGSLTAMASYFFKETREHQLIDFSKIASPVVV